MLSLDASLVEDAGPLRAQLNALRAEDGSDEPECLLDGLYRVETLPAMDKRSDPPDPCQWRCQIQAARIVVAFTDFSPHPVMPQPTGDTEAEAINSIHANRIFLSLFAPEMECHQTLGESNEQDYSAIAFDTNSPAGPQDALVAFTREKTNFKEALAALAKTRSMSHTEVL